MVKRARVEAGVIGEAIGSSLPAALAIAVTPLPLIVIAIVLTGPNGRRSGISFTLGWVLSLVVIAVLAVLLFEEAYETEAATGTTGYLIKIAIGAALILWGLKKGIGKLRASELKEPPGWISSLSDASELRAFGVAVLNAVNPKVLVLTAAAINAIVQTGVDGRGLVVATCIFLVIATAPVVGALVYALAGGASARDTLERTRTFLLTNTDVIVAVVLLLIGASVLGDGISGLGG